MYANLLLPSAKGLKLPFQDTNKLPSTLLLHGESAYPLCITDNGNIIMAASTYHKGRVIVLPHEGYVTMQEWKQYVEKCVTWLSTGCKGKPTVATDRADYGKFYGWMVIQRNELATKKPQVFVTTSYVDDNASDIVTFVKNGGGLFCAGLAWWWQSQNKQLNDLGDYPGNKFLNYLGISVKSSYISKAERKEFAPLQPEQVNLASVNVWCALKEAATNPANVKVESLDKFLKSSMIFTQNTVNKDAFLAIWKLLTQSHEEAKKKKCAQLEACLLGYVSELPSASGTPSTTSNQNNKGFVDLLLPKCKGLKLPFNDTSLIASTLILHGESAYPLCISPNDNVLVAASIFNKGKVIVIPHERYIIDSKWKPYLQKCITWCNASQKAPVIGTDRGDFAKSQGWTLMKREEFKSKKPDVYVTTSYEDKNANDLVDFVKQGGGLISGGLAWWWQSQNTSLNDLTNYPGNKFLNHFGISVLGSSVSGPERLEYDPLESNKIKVSHINVWHALQETMSNPANVETDKLSKLFSNSGVFTNNTITCPEFQPIWNLLDKAVNEAKKKNNKNLETCLSVAQLPKKLAGSKPGDMLTKDPTADNFPGVVTNYQAVKLSVTIDGNSDGYHEQFCNSNPKANIMRSTGLYAPAGVVIQCAFPDTLVNKGIVIQIGCHTDRIGNGGKRPNDIVTRTTVQDKVVRCVSPFGGLLYISIPSISKFGQCKVNIEGACKSPYFIFGQTSAKQWQDQIASKCVAPWSELEIPGQLIFSVPTKDIIKLSNPIPLMELWKTIMLGIYELCGMGGVRTRTERVVFDIQISVGYMHSGYPIMAQLCSVEASMDESEIRKNGAWGLVHEIGHNHQWASCEFSGTTEASVNQFTCYIHEKVLGQKRGQAIQYVNNQHRLKRMTDFAISKKQIGSDWQMWSALDMFLELIDNFGWSCLIQINKNYTSGKVEKITDQQKKMETLAVQWSNAAKCNLIPFFQSWGFPFKGNLGVDNLKATKITLNSGIDKLKSA